MGEPLPPSGTPNASSVHGAPHETREPIAPSKPQYIAYRPPGSEYTPPASPLHSIPNPYALPPAKKGFRSLRSKHPDDLQMDAAAAPAYERPAYSPSPSSSPTLPPAPPSPFLPRQRAPSLLRHAATPSTISAVYPRAADQPLESPTLPPSMLRQPSGPGPTSDPRTFFNPLASNPVGLDGQSSAPSSHEDGTGDAQIRARGMTGASLPDFVPHPPLRSTTSIPDYGQIRGAARQNMSAAYRPDRGNTNWSHNDYHPPPRHFRNEEPRASFRSAWTNASSFVDASGTERSSMATGRSSISDYRASGASRDHFEDLERIPNNIRHSAEPFETDDDVMSAVEEVINAYCYGDDDEVMGEGYTERARLESPGVNATDSDAPDLTRSDSQGGSSYYGTQEPSHSLERRPLSYADDADFYDPVAPPDDFVGHPQFGGKEHSLSGEYLPPLQLSPLHLQYSPLAVPSQQTFEPDTIESALRRRSGDDAQPSRTRYRDPSELGWPGLAEQITSRPDRNLDNKSPDMDRQQYRSIYNDLKDLPALPKNKARLSRQDWAEIQAYSKKNLRGSEKPLDETEEESSPTSKKRPPLAVHVPAIKTDSLPEVNDDDAYPRRASTSVFDRRSTLLDFNKAISPGTAPPKNSMALDFGAGAKSTGRQNDGQDPVLLTPRGLNSPRFPRPSMQSPSEVFERDRYGFKKATDKISLEDYNAWYEKYELYVSRRRTKWVALMEKQGLATSNPPARFPDPSERVRRYARKGYPPEWRGAMWWFYGGGERKLAQMNGVYASLVARLEQGELNRDDREAIERDLDRTFPDNIFFRPEPVPESPGKPAEEPSIVRNLREVLQCFALNNPSIGYCQSLNFIAGLLLLFMKQDVERVFVLLTIITQYHLPGAHARSLANTEVNVLMMLIKEYLPKVWNSINDTDIINNGPGSRAHPDSKFQRQPTVALSCTSWFMSLFVGVLPIEVVLRVWDAFLYEGPRALYRYALAIFKLGEPEIKKFHPGDGELFMTVQNLPRTCLDPNVLHDIAFVKKGFGSLSQNVIDQKRMFWQQQLARDRPAPGPAPNPGFLASRTNTMDSKEEEKKSSSGSFGGLRRRASKRFLKREKS